VAGVAGGAGVGIEEGAHGHWQWQPRGCEGETGLVAWCRGEVGHGEKVKWEKERQWIVKKEKERQWILKKEK